MAWRANPAGAGSLDLATSPTGKLQSRRSEETQTGEQLNCKSGKLLPVRAVWCEGKLRKATRRVRGVFCILPSEIGSLSRKAQVPSRRCLLVYQLATPNQFRQLVLNGQLLIYLDFGQRKNEFA